MSVKSFAEKLKADRLTESVREKLKLELTSALHVKLNIKEKSNTLKDQLYNNFIIKLSKNVWVKSFPKLNKKLYNRTNDAKSVIIDV